MSKSAAAAHAFRFGDDKSSETFSVMEAAVQALVRDFFHEASVQIERSAIDQPLERLIDDAGADSAVCKRDLRRLLERDPAGFLQAAGRVLRDSPDEAGIMPLLDLLWSSSLLLTSLVDPHLLSLPAAAALAERWIAFDCMLDIKLLQIGFPFGEDETVAADMTCAKRALDVVSALPPNRHVLLTLAKLLRHPDPHVRSKAALLYARASRNPDWVRKMLAEGDARVRANAVEGLWEVNSPLAAALFREAALDTDPHVAANALIGLDHCGERDAVNDILDTMLHSKVPAMRGAAAFVIGHIEDSTRATLEKLLRDRDAAVRGEALRSLIRIQRQDRSERPAAETSPLLAPAPALAPQLDSGMPPAA